MNSQIVAINQAVKSKNTFYLVTGFIPVSLFLNAGFISVAVIWFFAVCVYNFWMPARDRLKNDYVLFFPVAFFGLNATWVLFSSDFTPTIDLLLKKVHLLLIALGFILVDKKVTNKQLKMTLALFLTACLLASFICLVSGISNFIKLEGGPSGLQHYLTYSSLSKPVNVSPIYFSMFCNWAFLILLQTPYIGLTLKTITAIYIALFIILLSSKIGIACLVIITALWLQTTVYRKVSRYILSAGLTAVVLVGFIKFSSIKDLIQIDKSEQHGEVVHTLSSRLVIWSYAWETIKQNPIIGYGLGGGQTALEATYRKNGFEWGVRESLNTHNQFLSASLDLGLAGLAALLAMFVIPLIQAIQSKDLLAICFIVIVFAFFCVESVLARQKGIVFFSFFYSIVFSHLAARKQELRFS